MELKEQTKTINLKKISNQDLAYTQLIDHILNHVIILISPEGRILTWNKGAEKLFDYAKQEILERSLASLYNHEQQQHGQRIHHRRFHRRCSSPISHTGAKYCHEVISCNSAPARDSLRNR